LYFLVNPAIFVLKGVALENISLRELLNLGLQFGHSRSYTHPKAREFVYTIFNGVSVINLEKTREGLKNALKFVERLAKDNKTILFIGTKRQAAESIAREAEKIKMPYINKRFVGGTLTNFETVLSNIDKLKELEKKIDLLKNQEGANKRELRRFSKERERLIRVLGGLKDMEKMPDALFVVDVAKESNAVFEANRLNIPIVAMVDTNADPSKIDYPIPANDDTKRGVEFIISQVAEAYLKGSKEKPPSHSSKKRGEND